jgi:HD-GYP domain-containing protein (c-di-GMP phosphodiesterase class II)
MIDQKADNPGNSSGRFLPVHIDSLDPTTLEMDLWIRHAGQTRPALYRSKGVEVNFNDILRLREQRVQFLYISPGDHAVYRKQLIRKLDGVFADKSKAEQERARIIRANCSQMIEDVLVLPGQSEPVEAIADISRAFSSWVATDGSQFGYLLDMSAHDFHTSTHMVNVGVGCGLLVKHLRPDEPQLFPLAVQGGLLHDLGKRGIPEAVLNKGGKLAPEEWDLLKRHPQAGYDELTKHPAVPNVVLEMTRDHHERLDGKGYPAGKTGEAISFAARVCAVVDVFDAITSTRPYKGPTHPADTLKLMADGLGTQFDPHVFAAWKSIVDKMLEEDPSRTGAITPGENIFPFEEIVQVSAEAAGPGLQRACDIVASGVSGGLAGSERRRHNRFACTTSVPARFLRQIKPYPVALGETFQVTVADISRSGLGLLTPSPMARGDLLHLTLPGKDATPIERLAQVVRVRSRREGNWLIGLCFVDRQAKAA